MEKPGWVYIMASGRNGTLYIGATSDLVKRAWQHRTGAAAGFTKDYDCTLLVWFADRGSIEVARQRERAMKKWNRAWKLREIEAANPDWTDLFPSLV
jgi:putative endonuclease